MSSAVPLVITNGMLILDDIVSFNGSQNKGIIGGGGTFAMMGACIVLPSIAHRQRLAWIVDRGVDFPQDVSHVLESWDSGLKFRDDPSRLTTRGLNFYVDGSDSRKFKFLTAKKQICVNDWVDCFGIASVRNAVCFHLLCSSGRCLEFVSQIKELGNDNCTYIWEPFPDMCIPGFLPEFIEILSCHASVIVSPNAAELMNLLGMEHGEEIDLAQCKEVLINFRKMLRPESVCILRCGKHGVLVLAANSGQITHFPAYHTSKACVKDPTGGGNTFLGGFAAIYSITKDVNVASICGNIAAGCCVENVGVSKYDPKTGSWNGITFKDRLLKYCARNGIDKEICKMVV